MEKLQIIEQREVLGKEFKIYGDFENPLFKANDVAQWIEHSNVSKMLESIDNIEKVKYEIGTLTNSYSAWFLTEDGLYEVLMQSRKPIAKAFKKEVKIILKTIRQNGMYVTDKLLDDPDLAIKAFTKLKEEREKRKALETQIEEDKPKVLFANAVETSKSTILIGDLAKILKQNGIDIGQKRLFSWLRDNGYLIKRNGSDYNMPTQMSMELKLFEIKETAVTHSDGHITVNKTPKVTGKGQIYFINKFKQVS
ncbi:MAG: phage antirepressor KilAC domain-containing protein [Fusobacterium mortiferum]|uniref:phage antirepressor KilAC domain-containing protein n=1 Tax=Fusobacterium mortiferum TaxID=850 RepID=UPI000E432DDF|nr:phage antirepressor KilAC domain-containing protein [Fusobacterium mortiferum]MDY4801429.1 phage antirepressor KilAC domain-containing protein [Fusobacterium mortiferum]RGN00756.1 phage antirepressor Ant [Fusobacterium mortiferum]